MSPALAGTICTRLSAAPSLQHFVLLHFPALCVPVSSFPCNRLHHTTSPGQMHGHGMPPLQQKTVVLTPLRAAMDNLRPSLSHCSAQDPIAPPPPPPGPAAHVNMTMMNPRNHAFWQHQVIDPLSVILCLLCLCSSLVYTRTIHHAQGLMQGLPMWPWWSLRPLLSWAQVCSLSIVNSEWQFMVSDVARSCFSCYRVLCMASVQGTSAPSFKGLSLMGAALLPN